VSDKSAPQKKAPIDLRDNFRKSTLAYFSVFARKLFQSFDQALFEAAEKAKTNAEQSRYYESMREVRAKADSLTDRYQQFLEKGIADFLSGNAATRQAFTEPSVELRLVENDALEDELAISVIVARANTRFAETLWKLNRRLALLRGGKAIEDDDNPCGPAHLTHALRHAGEVLEIDKKSRIVMYKLFDKVVIPRAGEFYEKLNKHFVENNILPNLQFSVVKQNDTGLPQPKAANEAQPKPAEQTSAARSQQSLQQASQQSSQHPSQHPSQTTSQQPTAAQSKAQSAATPTAAVPLSNASGAVVQTVDLPIGFALINPEQERHQQELIVAIKALQDGRHGLVARKATAGGAMWGDIATTGKAGGQDTFAHSDFADALNLLQGQLQFPKEGMKAAKSVEFVESQFLKELGKLKPVRARHQVTEEDADVIDLVGMLFKYILDDAKLSDIVKSLLSHLHTPLLKVALLDKAFFSQGDHPARRLLNLMAEIGGRWVTEEEPDRVVFPRLRNMVARILKDFTNDITIFVELLGDLIEFARDLDKRSELAERRNREAEKGLEKLAKAKERAQREINERTKGKNIPKQARELLEQPWTDFLAFNLLRHGDQGLTWDSALKVVDGVLWSVQPQAAQVPDKMRAVQGRLEESIRQGLATIGYDQQASQSLLKDLAAAQALAVDAANQAAQAERAGEPPAVVEAAAPAFDPVQLSSAIARQQAKETLSADEAELAELTRKLKGLEFGTLFEFTLPGVKRPQVLRLAWFSLVSDHYMFVNQAGVKAAVKSRLELAHGIRDGSVRMVEGRGKSLMERAFETVLNRFRRAAASTT
jgi:hypothetical protein